MRSLLLIIFFLYSSPLVAYLIPSVEDFSYWEINELNPPKLREGSFYYGIIINGEIFISSMRESEAPIGQRAGGHFKLLRGWHMHTALNEGKSMEEALQIAREIYVKQSTYSERYHDANGFGFKPVRNDRGQLVLKWHGFNSVKSTINNTQRNPFSPNMTEVMLALSAKYEVGHEIVHPVYDKDLQLNPKYLDVESKYHRGIDFLWAQTQWLAAQLMRANEVIGYTNEPTRQILALSSDRSPCELMSIGALMHR